MIFGFNTDASHDGVVYHVQSEAREKDLLLQSQVFVKGRCIGKRACSYAGALGNVDESQLKERLKTQHRLLLDAITAGAIENALSLGEEIPDLDGELALQWLNPDETLREGSARLRLRVTDNHLPVKGVEVGAQDEDPGAMPEEAVTDSDGSAEIVVKSSAAPAREFSILIKATWGDKTATRKIRLRRTRA